MKRLAFNQLPLEYQKLLRAAKRIRSRAYAPYSGFSVGAAILTTMGRIFKGANFETASFSSICAERAALVMANSQGCGSQCKAIAIVTETGNATKISASCGDCRQFIYEAAQRSGIGDDFQIIMANTKLDRVEVSTIGELFPLAFGPKDLRHLIKTETKK